MDVQDSDPESMPHPAFKISWAPAIYQVLCEDQSTQEKSN